MPFLGMRDGGWLAHCLILIWLLYPTAIITLFYPEDVPGLIEYIQGLEVSKLVSHQAILGGTFASVIFLLLLTSLQFIVILLIYRRVQYAFSTWVLAFLLTGIGTNGWWWLYKGYFDFWGAMAGLSPVFTAIAIQGSLEYLGQDFVFGKGKRPDHKLAW